MTLLTLWALPAAILSIASLVLLITSWTKEFIIETRSTRRNPSGDNH